MVHRCKHIRKDLRKHKNKLVADKLDAWQDLKSISGIRGDRRKRNITSVLDEQGKVHDSKKGIVDVFATFYESLYKARNGNEAETQLPENTLPEITEKEVEEQLKKTWREKKWETEQAL